MLWNNHSFVKMCLFDWNYFSGEQCSPWDSCNKFVKITMLCNLCFVLFYYFSLSTSPLTVDRSRPMPTTVTRLFTPLWRGMFSLTKTKRKPTPRTSSRGSPCGDNTEVIPVFISARRSDCCRRGGGMEEDTPPPFKMDTTCLWKSVTEIIFQCAVFNFRIHVC